MAKSILRTRHPPSRYDFWRWVRKSGPFAELNRQGLDRLYGLLQWESLSNFGYIFEAFLKGRTPQLALFFACQYNPMKYELVDELVEYLCEIIYHGQHKPRENAYEGASRKGHKRVRISQEQRERRRDMIRNWREHEHGEDF